MEIEFLSEANAREWDEFALKSSSAWFRHTTAWMKYSSCCRFDSNTRNLSFMVKQDAQIQAIVPLLAEYSYPEMNFDCFAMYSDFTPLPAYADGSDVAKGSVANVVTDQIFQLASENGIRYGKFIIDPLIEYPYFRDFTPFNVFSPETGTKADFATTNLVDLTLDEDTIIRLMRKGHKAAIKQALKDKSYRVDIFDSSNITPGILQTFKAIHIKDAGRQTRTDASWQCMYEWIASGNGCLAMLWSDGDGRYMAGALIMIYKKAAYYASFATADSYMLNGHGGYLIQWNIIRYLKSIGVEHYETGSNRYPLDSSSNQFKISEISKYQRGFRSMEVPRITMRVDFPETPAL